MFLKILDTFSPPTTLECVRTSPTGLVSSVRTADYIGELLYVEGKGVRFLSEPFDTFSLRMLRHHLSIVCGGEVFDGETEQEDYMPVISQLAQALDLGEGEFEVTPDDNEGRCKATFTFQGYRFEARATTYRLTFRSIDFIPVGEHALPYWGQALNWIIFGSGRGGEPYLDEYGDRLTENLEKYEEERVAELEADIEKMMPDKFPLDQMLEALHRTIPLHLQRKFWAEM